MGLNYSMTGIFYNKALAAKIGMTKPPETVAEFEDLMAKAKAAGIAPNIMWNKPSVGLTFPLQNLMGAYGDPGAVNDWISSTRTQPSTPRPISRRRSISRPG